MLKTFRQSKFLTRSAKEAVRIGNSIPNFHHKIQTQITDSGKENAVYAPARDAEPTTSIQRIYAFQGRNAVGGTTKTPSGR